MTTQKPPAESLSEGKQAQASAESPAPGSGTDALDNEIGALEAMLGDDATSAFLTDEVPADRSVRPCRAADCDNAATCYAEVQTKGEEAKGLDGLTVPACDRHAAFIKDKVAQLFAEPTISVRIVPLPVNVRRWLRHRNRSRGLD